MKSIFSLVIPPFLGRKRLSASIGRRSLFLLTSLSLVSIISNANAASNVVISQVYGGGGNSGSTYKNDFIEIFNRGSVAVSLNGWSVQYASASGTSWTATALPNVNLEPGQYLLVQEALGTGGTVNLPRADASGSIAMSATAGKVVLANVTAAITNVNSPSVMDLIGFGTTAANFEGAAAAPAPSNTKAVLRGGDGCSDTDNNNDDFTASSPTPRNTATAFNVCNVANNAPIVAQCPPSLTVVAGLNGQTSLAASDADGIVNGGAITAGAVNGITLGVVKLAAFNGDSANFSLNVSNAVAIGRYALTVGFSNNQGQKGQCPVEVNVQAGATTSHTIPQIQGTGATSPYVNTSQTTEGVVTVKVANGFYMQDPVGDGNPFSSDGIYVFTGTAPTVANGDKVRLTGTVTEFNSGDAARTVTELTGVSGLVVLSSGNTITPTNVSLPLSEVNELERYEGMLVRFVSPLTVGQNYFLGRYGQVTLSSGRLEKPTNRYQAGSAQAIAAATANALNVIVLDDGLSTQNPVPTPYIGADNTLRAGDTVSNLTGVIDFGLTTSASPGPSGYKLIPSLAPNFLRNNPRTATPSLAIGNVRVSSFNVLNFFTTFTDGTTASGQTGQGCSLGNSVLKSNCRGADNAAEFIRQRSKIVSAMKAINADVFGLMEMQNNGDVAVNNLVTALNAVVGNGTYAVVPAPAMNGSTGSDAIRVAMIYKPAKLTLIGTSMSDTDAINNRPPLAQTFDAGNGQRFSLIVNHMKSKGSCPSAGSLDADQGDGQGCWTATRIKQVQRLLTSFIPQVKSAANDPDVLIIGDMNAYGAEDPINAMVVGGLVNEIERFVRPSMLPYSYVFDGESGYIDHALASATLNTQVAGVTEWHINADEPAVIDYNTEFKTQDLYSATPFRASDHDPVVISLNLQAPAVDVSNRMSFTSTGLVLNRSTGTYNGTLSITNTSANAIVGPLQVEFNGVPTGVTLFNANGYRAGLPYLSVALTTIAAGQTVVVPVQWSNPGRLALSYTLKFYSGNF